MNLTDTPQGISLTREPQTQSRLGKRGVKLFGFTCMAIIILIMGGLFWRMHREQLAKEKKATPDALVDENQAGNDVLHDMNDKPLPPVKQAVQQQPAKAVRHSGTGHTGEAKKPKISDEDLARISAYNREWQAAHTHLMGSTTGGSGGPSGALGRGGFGGGAGVPFPLNGAGGAGTADYARGLLGQQGGKNQLPDEEYVNVHHPNPRAITIKSGTWIDATLDMKTVSEVPGDLHATVASDIKGAINGNEVVAIPTGSALIGLYEGRLVYGQNRVVQLWTKVVFRDGRSIKFDAPMNAMDEQGASGLRDKVDNHWDVLLRDAAILTAFSTAVALTQRSQSLLQSQSYGNAIGAGVGSQLGQLGSRMTERNLNLMPTAEIRPGKAFKALVTRDIVISGL